MVTTWPPAVGEPMSIESLTYAELAGRLGTSPEAARSLARRLRLPRKPGNDGKVRITIDLDEIQYKPLPARSPGGQRADIDALNARIARLQAELASFEVEKLCLEASAAGHRADFERERERCDTLMAETLCLTKVALSAREKAARLEGAMCAREVRPWWRRFVAAGDKRRPASAVQTASVRGRGPAETELAYLRVPGVPVRI